MDHVVCKNRKNQRRISMEVCQYHVETKDRACMKMVDGRYACPVVKQIMEETNGSSEKH